jgi:hypothetical protein
MCRKSFIAVCVFSLLFAVDVSAGEKQGAQLLIINKGGDTIQGELITVKSDALLLFSKEGTDVTIAIEQVDEIRVIKKSNWLLGAGIGGAIGALGGALLLNDIWYEEHGDKTKSEAALQSGVVFGGVGLLLGGMTGAYAGQDMVYPVSSYQPAEVSVLLKKLSKQARVSDFQ